MQRHLLPTRSAPTATTSPCSHCAHPLRRISSRRPLRRTRRLLCGEDSTPHHT
jgi:hypothetical protein